MPQLDISTYSSQLFWLFVCFSILYLFISKVAIPMTACVLEERQNRIESPEKKATELQLETDRLQAEFEHALSEARMKAHELVLTSLHDTNLLTVNRKKESADKVLEHIQAAEESIRQKKVQSLTELKTIVEPMVTHLVEKLTEIKLDSQEVSKDIDAVLKSRAA